MMLALRCGALKLPDTTSEMICAAPVMQLDNARFVQSACAAVVNPTSPRFGFEAPHFPAFVKVTP